MSRVDPWSIMKNLLTDWAKVGTMLAVSHYLSGGSFNEAWQKATLFTLLGFSTYDVLTGPLLNTEVFGPLKPIADDWVKVGTMMIVSRLLSGKSLRDQKWIQASLFTLLGFTAYNLTTKHFIQGDQMCPPSTMMTGIINDWAKVGTMLLVSRLLSGEVPDRKWLLSSLYTLLGFSTYHLTSAHLINQLP